jgi:3-phosphoshikimate 1-carboxyvinyltransferase
MFADGTSTILNVGNLRIKETDRLHALSSELARLGAKVDVGEDYLEITPGPPKDAAVETYDDHRMAMAMSLVGLGRPGVVIKDPACVAKTYPRFFQDLEAFVRK